MPPKRTRYATSSSAQQATSEASSMHDEDEIRFSTPEAEEEFQKLLSKPVGKERGFLPTIQDGDLLEMIRAKGWEFFCETPEAVPLSIVKEFYANAKPAMDGYSVVRGMTVDYTPAAIRRVVHQRPKPRNMDDWTFKSREEVDLDYTWRSCVFQARDGRGRLLLMRS